MKLRMAAMLLLVAALGCKGGQSAPGVAAASGEGGASAYGAGADGTSAAGGGGAQLQYIADPSLGMNAIAVTIPARWQIQSVFLQGGTCAPTPFGVFRAVSPDGQSMVERMPNLAWAWGQGPMIGYMPKTDCLPMKGPMSAQDFLKYMAATMKVNYDGPVQVPQAEEEKAQQAIRDAQARYAPQFAAIGAQPPKQNRELARAAVSYQKTATPMKGVLDVVVDCTETQFAGQPGLSNRSPGHPPQATTGQGSTVDKCVASVTYYTAPANQIGALMQQWDAPGMGTKPVDAWVEAWINRNNQQTRGMIDNMNRAAAAQRQATADQFAHSMAVQQQTHDEFMRTMQEGTDRSMARTYAGMQARDTSTSDWVDYALDRQTVINPNTGLVYKVPSQVTVEQPLERAHGNGTPW